MNERQKQQNKPKFIGSDGSVLESLPSDVIGPEAMQSLEQYLGRLTDYDSCQASSLPDVAAEVSTVRSVSSSSPLMSPTAMSTAMSMAVEAPTGDSLPTHIAPFGKESSNSSLHDMFAGDHSDHGYTDDYRHDTLDSDGEAHDGLLDIDGVKSEDPDALGMTGDIGDGHEGTKPARAEHKRTKGGRKRPREGEIAASEAQRQKASRDRNREHARNTRIRKKQFVENLRQQVEELLQMKARTERDALVASSKAMTERATRRQMVLNVFYLRATEDLSRQSWTSILDESFTCISPLTPFRWFPPSEAREDHRLIAGIDGMIQDTASLAVFIQSICRRSQNPAGQKVNYQYYTSPEDTVVGPNALMCRWLMKTENATTCGAQCEVFSHGMLKAKFTSENRIKHLELVFDVMSFMQQIQRAMGGGGFIITPNTLEAAIQPSRQARLVCYAEAPFWIVRANQGWTALMGYSDEEQVKLLPLSLLNGPAEASTGGELEALVQTCVVTSLKRATMGVVHVVTKDMRRLAVSTQAYPLGDRDGSTTHLLLVMEEVPVCQASAQPGIAHSHDLSPGDRWSGSGGL